jgi:hypothetical protein
MEKELERYLDKIRGIPPDIESKFSGYWKEPKTESEVDRYMNKGVWK